MNNLDRYELYSDIKSLFLKDDLVVFYEVINKFNFLLIELKSNPFSIFSESHNVQSKRNEIKNKIANTTKEIINLGSLAFYKEIFFLEREVEKVSNKIKTKENLFSGVLDKLKSFQVSYDVFLTENTEGNFLNTAIIASELKEMINQLKNISPDLLGLKEDINPLEKDRSLSLYLSNVETLDSFAKKLQSFSDIYKEVLHLNNTSEIDCPLKLEYIENGSLTLKVFFGSVVVTKLMTSLIDIGVDYYHDNYTLEGKITTIHQSSAELDRILKLSEQLERSGIDTIEIKETINKSLVKIAKNLDVLISDQPLVLLNNNKKNIDKKMKDLFIEQTKKIEKL
ncbi:hypothetical protein TW85_16410 [Marinomonas sp. S3726]|uniref:hypothetical protein n=1 Tax=Marinomonas sp. S3726 TaxID=579484 RepID=UPI0005FA1224|nr:hypothetical protein [Marinomonas sp. S3726]KJZ11955.1 hypothetical protein TW85_16410 [Marinomonas sp. S3726]